MEIYSIGFTQKSAAEFFGALKSNGIQRLLDVRLNNTSQLAGFAKKNDLIFFLRELCGADYEHAPHMAPTQDMLDAYKKQKGTWEDYARQFTALMESRQIESSLSREGFHLKTVLLCSEPTSEHCHRRLVLEYLQHRWPGVIIHHL